MQLQPLSRAVKKVTIQLGLFTFPVTVHSSVIEDKEAALKNVCTGSGKSHTMSTLTQTNTCPVCGNHDAKTMGKAKVAGTGLIAIPKEVIAAAEEAEETFANNLQLGVFPADQVSASVVPSGKSYYLKAGDGDLYATLVELIATHPEWAFVTQWSIRSAASLFQLVVEGGNLLVLRQLADPTVVRERPQMSGTPDLMNLAAAEQLASNLLEDFDMDSYERPKAKILADYVAGKLPDAPALARTASNGEAQIISLLDALAASLAAKKATSTRRTATKSTTAPKKTATKTAAKKTVAKKTTSPRISA